MQSNEYNIERWDAIYDDKLNIKRPLVYIVPDPALIEFAESNKDNLYATIKGTGNQCYDNNKLQVSLVSIKETRPNFFNKSNYYTLQFKDSIWNGYPKSLGTISFEGVNKQVEQPKSETPSQQPFQPTEAPQPTIEKFMTLNLNNKPNSIIVILVILLILVLAFRFLP